MDSCNFHNSEINACKSKLDRATAMVYSAGLNFYNLYGDCINTRKKHRKHSARRKLDDVLKGNDKYSRSMSLLFQNITRSSKLLMANVPCIDSVGANIYLNRADVQRHLHVIAQDNRPWAICSDVLHYTKLYDTMYDVYQEIFTYPNVRGISYNGDTDMACNFLGNEWFAESLNRDVEEYYQPWHLKGSGQISGFVKKYDRFTYYTVKGAGHMVPQWRPDEALYILLDLLNLPERQRKQFERQLFEHLV